LVHDDSYPDVMWTSPLEDFIPADFALEDPHATAHTTIEDALSHRSGLPRHDLMYGQLNDTVSSIVKRMRYLPMTAEPRTTWQYCNIMFGAMTDVIETITGQKLEAVLRENFWKPLGMSSTTFTLPSAVDETSHLARGYYWDKPVSEQLVTSKGRYVPEPYIDISPISGAGSTISTVNDYALWIRAWLNAARVGQSRNTSSPITRRIFHDLLSPRAIVSELADDEEPDDVDFITPPNYALGWAAAKVGARTIVSHNGGLTGFGTDVYMLPGHEYGIITMANTAGTSNIAGAIIASRLLLEKFNVTSGHEVWGSELRGSLITMANANLHRPKFVKPRLSRSFELPPSTLYSRVQPVSGSVIDLAGRYTHPAYGTIDLNIATSQDSLSESILESLIYPRLWPLKIQLYHITNTVFAVKAFTPHGLGNITSGEDIVWEDENDDDRRAFFELGLDGAVETMGIELEDSMVDMARRKGRHHWKDGMIWFEKI
jgi:CubicO group peptidase (beta-lactamase class C family)